MNKPLFQLVAVNLKMFWREPGIIFWAIFFPILMAWVLGVAFTTKTELRQKVYVVASEGTRAKGLTNTVVAGEGIGPLTHIEFVRTTREEAYLALKRGETDMIVEQQGEKIVFNYDLTNPEAVNTYLLLERQFNGPGKDKGIIISPISTRGNRYVDFLIPGLIALGILNSCIWGISWTLIDIRMKKLLRRMVATPMKKSTFILSHFITRIILTTIEALILVLFAYFYFQVSIEGSLAALFMVYLAGVIAFCGIAVCIASRTANSQVGSGLINAATLPMMILSGIFFSYHNFPEWAIPVIKVLPLTILADTIRSIFNEGLGFQGALFPSAILLATGSIFYAAGIKMFKWY